MLLILQMKKLSLAEMEKNSPTHSEWRITVEIQVASPVPPKPWPAWKMEFPVALHPVFSNCLKESWNEWTETSSLLKSRSQNPQALAAHPGLLAPPAEGPL